jgi:hypothetical protein
MTASKQQEEELNSRLNIYLDKVHILSEQQENLEFETKFGSVRNITKIEYDNVVKKLKSVGFSSNESKYLLRIQSSTAAASTAASTAAAGDEYIRTEIEGLHNVQKYCQTNSIELDDDGSGFGSGISFIQKKRYQEIRPLDYPDFDFRISLSNEKNMSKESPLVRDNIMNEPKWKQTRKIFRYMNRYTFLQKDDEYPFMVDVSIVKSSRKQRDGKGLISEYTIQNAGVFKSQETYEIEIECVNAKVGLGTKYNTVELLKTELKKTIKYILAGLQGTNYPISYPEQDKIIGQYQHLFQRKDFAGPSSVTLQLSNIVKLAQDQKQTPNITRGYTVTDKADGDRKLLFIAEDGKIYLISTNMQVQFTGAITKKTELYNTVLDGEHIIHDKHKNFINRYTVFDIYYMNGVNVRAKEFVKTNYNMSVAAPELEKKYRLNLLETVITTLNAVSVVDRVSVSPLVIVKKTFYYTISDADDDIFKKCGIINQKIKNQLFDYHTDGLIFTPAYLGVTSEKTWWYSFKWKPVEQNTIDFLVRTKKNTTGSDDVKYISSAGVDLSSVVQVNKYKTLILHVGFDRKRHGTPYDDMIHGRISEEGNEFSSEYAPTQFFPSDPYDQNAGICNVSLHEAGNGHMLMMTENGEESFEDETIVEFRYDNTRDHQWRWVPIRVRYDKTTGLRSGAKNFGNSYDTANNVWNTLYNPIPEEMISTGNNVLNNLVDDDDVYYNKVTGEIKTQALRDFHNKYVKSRLIACVSQPGNTLIDLAVGKAGDLHKWTNARLKFVFGVDISRDNIINKDNGACRRYINYRKESRKNNLKTTTTALFVNGNSSKNIRDAAGIVSEKDKQITRAVFGQGEKNEETLGKGVYSEYGIGQEGFDVCSIQFAVHYMFKDQQTLHGFLRNVSETTKLGGYFIGTSYDGKILFDKLKNTAEGESLTTMSGDKKIWEVVKKYNQRDFPADSTCTGYAVDVYQDSINKYFVEYLVNYDYFTKIIQNYGFILLETAEYKNLGLPKSTGLFKDLYETMLKDKSNYVMSAGEKTISFLNRYFVYKKINEVDALKEMERNLIVSEPMSDPTSALIVTESATIASAMIAPATLSFKPKKKAAKLVII